MPEWTEVVGILIGAGGFVLAIVAFYLGFTRHRENTTSEDKRHKEAMAKQADSHREAMDKEDKRHKEAMKAADRRERALEAIIRNTAPRPGPAE